MSNRKSFFTRRLQTIAGWLIMGTPLFLNPGCGAGSSVGNGVIIQSDPYSNTRDAIDIDLYAAVSEFKFCITKIKVVATDGTAASSIEKILGLIDVSNASAATKWGELDLAAGSSIQELAVEVHKDPERCSQADYSVIYNGTKLTKDLEFTFRFDPKITAGPGDTLKLGLTNIAKAFEQAATAGKLNNEQIGDYLQSSTKGTGTK